MRVNYQFINVKTIHSSKRLKKKLFFTEKKCIFNTQGCRAIALRIK